MNRIYRALAAALFLAATTGAALQAAGEGRLAGVVTDESGAPIAGAQVIFTSTEFKYEQKRTTDAKGKFTILVLDATKTYQMKIEKEGYIPVEQPMKLKLEESMKETFVLTKPAAPAPAPESSTPQELSGESKAINAFNEGVLAFQGGDTPGSIAKFKEATELDPKLAAAWGALADMQLTQNQYAEAAAAADKFLELDPGKPRGLRTRYDAYKALGDKEKAAAALDALVAADPSRETAIRVFNEGAEASRRNDTAQAATYLRKALEVDPTLDQAYSALSGLYLTHKQFKEAVEVADKMLARDAGNLEALTVRHEAYKGMGDKAKAAEALAALSAANAGGSPDSFFKQGVSLFNANNFEQAKAAFERVLAIDPNHPKANYMMGLVYTNNNQPAKAKEYLKKFLQLAPKDEDAGTAKEMLKYLD